MDAIVNEDKIGTFDKRPNDLSMEVIITILKILHFDAKKVTMILG